MEISYVSKEDLKRFVGPKRYKRLFAIYVSSMICSTGFVGLAGLLWPDWPLRARVVSVLVTVALLVPGAVVAWRFYHARREIAAERRD